MLTEEEEYRRRREANNAAVKLSRERARQKKEERKKEELRRENERLRASIEAQKRAVDNMNRLYKCQAKQNPGFAQSSRVKQVFKQ